MSPTDSLAVRLPWACSCGSTTGKFNLANAVCADCGKHCVSVSDTTMRVLTALTQKFGAPIEPVIFRSPKSALTKIEQQDLLLKTHYVRDGRSMYQVITDIFEGVDEPPSDSDGELEAVED